MRERFPVWLSPVQVVMIPISERHAEYANKVADQLKAIGVRVEVDARNEKMNAKIREHAMQKVPFLLVVGDKEAEAGKVNVRTRGKEKTEDMLGDGVRGEDSEADRGEERGPVRPSSPRRHGVTEKDLGWCLASSLFVFLLCPGCNMFA